MLRAEACTTNYFFSSTHLLSSPQIIISDGFDAENCAQWKIEYFIKLASQKEEDK